MCPGFKSEWKTSASPCFTEKKTQEGGGFSFIPDISNSVVETGDEQDTEVQTQRPPLGSAQGSIEIEVGMTKWFVWVQGEEWSSPPEFIQRKVQEGVMSGTQCCSEASWLKSTPAWLPQETGSQREYSVDCVGVPPAEEKGWGGGGIKEQSVW